MTPGRFHLSQEGGSEGGGLHPSQFFASRPALRSTFGPMSLNPQPVPQATPWQVPLCFLLGRKVNSGGAAGPPKQSALWGGILGKNLGVPSDLGVAWP